MGRVEIAGQRPVQPFPPRSHNWVYSTYTHRESANPSGSDQRTYASTNMSSKIPDPDDVTEAQLANHLEGRPIRYSPDKVCSRCDSKNSLRMKYEGADWDDLADETFEERERIRFTVVYDEQPWLPGLEWAVRGLFHERHPQQSQEEIAAEGVAQAMGTATLVRAEDATTVHHSPEDEYAYDDELVLTDVTIELYSPPSEGEDTTPSEPEGMVVAKGIGDRDDWPEEENEWRKELIRSAEKSED